MQSIKQNNRPSRAVMLIMALCLMLSALPILMGSANFQRLYEVTIDNSTHAMTGIEYEHHEIHTGDHYSLCDFETEAISATIEFVLTTPDTAKWAHMTFSVTSSQGVQLQVFEDTTGVVGGTAMDVNNNNRNSSNLSVLTGVKDPTSIAGDGTEIQAFSAGANNRVGFIERSKEIVLKQDTVYLFRITSLNNNNIISYCGEWYEHTAIE